MKRLVLESNNNSNLEVINETENKEKFIANIDSKTEL
jgi:hypothetical protein